MTGANPTPPLGSKGASERRAEYHVTDDRALHVGRPNVGPREVFDRYVDRIFDNAWLTNDGPVLQEFESEVADRLSVKHCVAMCNGTVALEIAIRALDLTGEVIIPSFTFVATAHALSWQGITPVFADIDPLTHCLDPQSVEAAVTDRTTGIIGVHLWGRTAPVEALQAVADKHDLALLYDAAHAFGCTHRGKPVGGFGRAEVLSFHATKFFNTFEGGAIVTDDDDLAAKARLMRNFGFAGYDNVIYPGTNGKMTEICAAMGLTNLLDIDEVIAENRRVQQAYAAELDGVPGLGLLSPLDGDRSNFQYVVAMVSGGAERRDTALHALQSQGILARKYFWPGVHRMEPYASSGRSLPALPATQHIADSVLVLPGGPSISRQDAERVSTVIKEALS